MPNPIEISKLHLDGGTQPRVELAEDVIREYAQAMADGAQFPPVVALHDGESYWLADGFHRVKAAARAGLEHILAETIEGTQADAQWHSLSVNKTHGLRRTNADKEKAVLAALAHPKAEGLSNVQIAAHCGVSEATVRAYRKEAESTSQIAKSTIRTGKDGRTINTANIGKRTAPPRRRVFTESEYEQYTREKAGAKAPVQSPAPAETPDSDIDKEATAGAEQQSPGCRTRSKNEARRAGKLIGMITSLPIYGGPRGWNKESCEEISTAIAALAQRWNSEKDGHRSSCQASADTTAKEADSEQ
jgi:transposase